MLIELLFRSTVGLQFVTRTTEIGQPGHTTTAAAATEQDFCMSTVAAFRNIFPPLLRSMYNVGYLGVSGHSSLINSGTNSFTSRGISYTRISP